MNPAANTIDDKISRDASHEVVVTSWGKLVWQVSAPRGNSENLTVGICYINPGQANGRHIHPNCEEVLIVKRGRIVHTWGDSEAEMNVGDSITIPAGIVHNARNIGDDVAELTIVFSSAYRETIDAE